jgi:hypothetical protein
MPAGRLVYVQMRYAVGPGDRLALALLLLACLRRALPAKVKPSSLCTERVAQAYPVAMWLHSAKIGLYIYFAQAAAGAAIGFALPFVNLLIAR